jgi:hypothetical protein
MHKSKRNQSNQPLSKEQMIEQKATKQSRDREKVKVTWKRLPKSDLYALTITTGNQRTAISSAFVG